MLLLKILPELLLKFELSSENRGFLVSVLLKIDPPDVVLLDAPLLKMPPGFVSLSFLLNKLEGAAGF